MDREVFVYLDTRDGPRLVGRLWTRAKKGRQSATFEYDPGWLDAREHFALEPALMLTPGPHQAPSDKPLFGAIGDSAPDRWGRELMRRAERRRARDAGETPRTLLEIDYLLGVNDESRPGALRFALKEGGPFLAPPEDHPIPPLIDLPELLGAADRIADDSETSEDLRLILAPGSSLGGARPKASVRDRDGSLAIAKFPHKTDVYDAVRWEATALSLAERAGIVVPTWRLEEVAGRPVLILKRFDRNEEGRVPFLSALSMLSAKDHDTHSYMEIADALRKHGASPSDDMRALWRRIVFTVLISNTDDHLRNHGFLYTGPNGWTLAPAYDLNPVPADLHPRVLKTAIDEEDTTALLAVALEVAGYFELEGDDPQKIAREVGEGVSTWRREAAAQGLTKAEIDRMESAFEHEDLRAACA